MRDCDRAFSEGVSLRFISGKATFTSLAMTIFIGSFYLAANIQNLALAATGASFLKLGVGARALGLGSAYTAVANDVTALHWNPAGLSQLNKKEIGAMHAELFADSRYDFFGYAMPILSSPQPSTSPNPSLQRRGVIGVGAVYLTQGALEGRSESRAQTADFSASDLAITMGASRFVTRQVSLGMNLKIIQSKIAGFSSTGFAMDFGSLYHPSSLSSYPLTFGFAIQNVGSKMQFLEEGYQLPLTLAGGVGYNLLKSFLISADLKHQPYDSRTAFGIGTEFSPVSILSLRAGYITSAMRPTNSANNGFTEQISNLSGLGLGVGLKLGPSVIDYSFTPAGELGNSQRISLSLKF
jgi:hypothetical protein